MRTVVLMGMFGVAVFCRLSTGSPRADARLETLSPVGGVCDPGCDYCWCGTEYENNCPPEWFSDADCDCGCQFCDLGCSDCAMQDCGGGPGTGACCCPDLTCVDAVSQADCLSADCAYRGNGSGCTQGCPCDDLPLPCDWCWLGTSAENNCSPEWYGTNDGCDCGCQWQDPDCGGGCNPVCGDGTCEPDCDEDCSSCPQDCGPCCGNGVIDDLEECDDVGESATCDADCTFVSCGDGTLNATAGEQCEPSASGCCDTICHFELMGTPCSDDLNACTDDVCDGAGICEHRGDDTNDCDDGAFCNGAEYCDSGVCISPGDPCIGGGECHETCNEAEDNCFDLVGVPCGDGLTDCSDQDTCDGAGNCNVNDLPPGTVCGDPSDTPCDNADTCDGTGTCLANHTPSGSSCDDGEPCNGVEACDGSGNCIHTLMDDCNENEVEDACDVEDGTSFDCNVNDIPDECDIAQGTSRDENGDGMPDECEAHVDIKPGSCPNPVNPRSNGVVPMAIVGTDLFDVTRVDIDTLILRRADGVGGFVTPLRGPPGPGIKTQDVATPFVGELCSCHDAEEDGIDDVSLKFSTPELAEALELIGLPRGTSVMLTVSGSLLDGTAFEASDCVVIPGRYPPPKPHRQREPR